MVKTLYICYFGVRQALVQTQVIPYLLEIAKDGVAISLLTFEPDLKANWTTEQIETERKHLAEKGIDWHCLAYHKRFSVIATAYDVFGGVRFVHRTIRENNIDILHGRSHVATLMGALAKKFSKRKPKLLFDIRGFFPEEYTDAGVWPEGGLLFRTVKRIERWLMKEADGFVVLTEKAREILFPESSETGFDNIGRPVEVIPCCVDLERFKAVNNVTRSDMRKKLGVEDRNVIAYVGSFGGWYLTDEMIDFYVAARESDRTTFALILTQRDKEVIARQFRQKGFADTDFLVETVPPSGIANYLNSADMAISFIKACYSKLSSSPTKIAEYLAAGVPIIFNSGVGDLDHMLGGENVGIVVENFTTIDYEKALHEIHDLKQDDRLRTRCEQTAMKFFALEGVGGVKYRKIYKRLTTIPSFDLH